MYNSRNTYIEIDLDKLKQNYEYIKSKTSANINAVIKANAYGHGAIKIAKMLTNLGVEKFSVAFWEEAKNLREAGLKNEILILNYVDAEYIKNENTDNITFTVFTINQLEKYINVFQKKITCLKFAIKINTGMNRLGIKNIDEIEKINLLKEKYNLKIVEAFTHCYAAEDVKVIEEQKYMFQKIVKCFKFKFDKLHFANSCAFFQGQEYHFDEVRIGMALYGLQPLKKDNIVDLEEILTWKSIISSIRKVNKGENIGYGNIYKAKKDMVVGVVPVGYFDGYKYMLSNRASVLLRDKRCPIVSEVCMEQIIIDISHISAVKEGEKIYIIGGNEKNKITARELARLSGTVSDDIVCGINKNLDRVYVRRNDHEAKQNTL